MALSLTANALFTIYDKFGYTSNIVATLSLADPSAKGWENTCWLFALLASEGEKQRRLMGEDPRPMVGMEALRHGCAPGDVAAIRSAVLDALSQGFRRSVESEEAEEVDLVLLELDEIEKKKKAAAAIEQLSWLFALSGSTSPRATR